MGGRIFLDREGFRVTDDIFVTPVRSYPVCRLTKVQVVKARTAWRSMVLIAVFGGIGLVAATLYGQWLQGMSLLAADACLLAAVLQRPSCLRVYIGWLTWSDVEIETEELLAELAQALSAAISGRRCQSKEAA